MIFTNNIQKDIQESKFSKNTCSHDWILVVVSRKFNLISKSKIISFFALTLINIVPLQFEAYANLYELENILNNLSENEKFEYGMMFGAGATICELNALNLISLSTAKTFRKNSIKGNGYLAKEAFDLGVKLIKPYLDGEYCYGL